MQKTIQELVREKIATLPKIGELVEISHDGAKAPVTNYIIGNSYGSSNECVINSDLETFYHYGLDKVCFIREEQIEDITYQVDYRAIS